MGIFLKLSSQEINQTRGTWVVTHNKLGYPCLILISLVWWICFLLTACSRELHNIQRNLWAAWWCWWRRKNNSETWIKHRKICTGWRRSRRTWARDSLMRRWEILSATSSVLVPSETVSLENNFPNLLSPDSFLLNSFWQKYLL